MAEVYEQNSLWAPLCERIRLVDVCSTFEMNFHLMTVHCVNCGLKIQNRSYEKKLHVQQVIFCWTTNYFKLIWGIKETVQVRVQIKVQNMAFWETTNTCFPLPLLAALFIVGGLAAKILTYRATEWNIMKKSVHTLTMTEIIVCVKHRNK